MPLAPGTRLGAYEISGQIGAGGMGDVYRARDTGLDRIVALKISKAEFTPRFETEARAIAALEHPHICRLYDVCHEEGSSFLVMEYVEGTPLTRPLPLERHRSVRSVRTAVSWSRSAVADLVRRRWKRSGLVARQAGDFLRRAHSADYGRLVSGRGRFVSVRSTASLVQESRSPARSTTQLRSAS